MADLPITSDEGAIQVEIVQSSTQIPASVSTQNQLLTKGHPYYLADNNKLFEAVSEVSTTLGTTETSLLLLKNPAASGKTIKIKRIELGNFVNIISSIRFRLYFNPTITSNGGTLTPQTLTIGGSGTSVALLFTLPTTTANGTKLYAWQVPDSTSSITLNVPIDYELLLSPNYTLLFTGQGDGINRAPVITIIWAEI